MSDEATKVLLDSYRALPFKARGQILLALAEEFLKTPHPQYAPKGIELTRLTSIGGIVVCMAQPPAAALLSVGYDAVKSHVMGDSVEGRE